MGTQTRPRAISPATRFGGLIGKGISHSLSPLIHNTAAEILGLDIVYLAFDMAAAPRREFFETLLFANCYGFNVTLPYKEDIARLLHQPGLISCNTLINAGERWEGASTDAEGFLAGLKEIGKTLDDFDAVICLGNGGAAKALLACFAQKRPNLPCFVLKRGAESETSGITYAAFSPEALRNLISRFPKALLIQGTSAPLKGDDLSAFCPSIQGLKGAFVDLVYGRPSALYPAAQSLGIASQDGLPMLLHQALLSEQLWWGQSADFSAMKAALSTRLNLP